MSEKHTINLLQPELLPQTPPLTLQRVLLILLGVLIMMVVAISITQAKLKRLNTESVALQQKQQRNNEQLADLEKQIKQHKQSPELINKLTQLKTILKYKQSLKRKLTDKSTAYVAGFSGAMSELSQYYSNNISLQNVVITADKMTFEGIAKSPDAVPLWLSGFKTSTFLTGMSFSHFKLTEDKQHITRFVVSSDIPKGDQ